MHESYETFVSPKHELAQYIIHVHELVAWRQAAFSFPSQGFCEEFEGDYFNDII